MGMHHTRHLTWQEAHVTRCTSAGKWLSEAMALNPEEDPSSVLTALRLAREDIDVAMARLLANVPTVPAKKAGPR